MPIIHVTVLSKQDCHLCRIVYRMAQRLQQDMAFDLSKVDIDTDPHLATRYGNRLPVVLIDQVESLSGKMTERDLRRAIQRARWRRPISRILYRLREALTRR